MELTATPAQQRVIDALQKRFNADPASPTLQNLADDLRCTPSTVLNHLKNLEQQGWLTRERYQRKSIKFTHAAVASFR